MEMDGIDVRSLIISANDFVPGTLTPSTALTVKFDVPAVVGVPEIVPDELSIKPGGKLPLVISHVYGAVPPAAESVCEYTPPTVPAGSVDGVMVMVPLDSGATSGIG